MLKPNKIPLKPSLVPAAPLISSFVPACFTKISTRNERRGRELSLRSPRAARRGAPEQSPSKPQHRVSCKPQMAQAARLNLRMQKEIKLLLDDPPHGVSLNISNDESGLSSLSCIEARIEGPEGTVYSKGVFILKIQIPERYPFQPPNVTFVTPIYHPNIDNGGRICLDILNLPPKGAWQPSINIATVLTSIGLLLSEPNPDDGLMAEISREYKYNRQVFDSNARLWTEKYANSATVGASGWGSVDVTVPLKSTQSEDMENPESLPNAYNKDCEGNQIKRQSLRQKLSLKSERSEKDQDTMGSHSPSITISINPTACFPDGSGKQNAISENLSISDMGGMVSKKECEGNGKMLQLSEHCISVTLGAPSERSNGNDMKPNNNPATSVSNAKDCAMQSSDAIAENGLARSFGGSSDSLNKPVEGNRRNIRRLGLKLSLKSVKPEKKSNDQKENMVPNHMPSHSNLNNVQKRPLEDVSSNNLSEATTPIPKQQLPNSQLSNGKGNQGSKKLCLLRDRLSLKPKLPQTDRTCNKGSMPPAYPQGDDRKLSNEVPLSAPVPKSETVARSELPLSAPVFNSKTMAIGSAGSQEDVNPNNRRIMQSAASIENIVVSDSEDSADECERPSRSQLSLMRRRLAGKLRS